MPTLSKKHPPALLFALPLLVLFLIASAHSATFTASTAMPWDSALSKIQSSITGPFAALMSLGGIVVAGAALIFGAEMNAFFKSMITVVLVVALIVGANNIIALFSGAMIGAPGAHAYAAASLHLAGR